MPYLGQIRRVGPHSHFLKFHCYFIAPVLTMPQNKVSQGCKLGWGGVLEKISKLVSLKPFERTFWGKHFPKKYQKIGLNRGKENLIFWGGPVPPPPWQDRGRVVQTSGPEGDTPPPPLCTLEP